MAAGVSNVDLSTEVNRVVDVDTGSLLAVDTTSIDQGRLRWSTWLATWWFLLHVGIVE